MSGGMWDLMLAWLWPWVIEIVTVLCQRGLAWPWVCGCQGQGQCLGPRPGLAAALLDGRERSGELRGVIPSSLGEEPGAGGLVGVCVGKLARG